MYYVEQCTPEAAEVDFISHPGCTRINGGSVAEMETLCKCLHSRWVSFGDGFI